MTQKPYFSIIVPVYNAEKFLASTIENILSQSFSDFELILVNDCSPDNSASICEAYAEKDKRIKVIHNDTNRGPGGSRNVGLANANGEYIMYMDSDDTVSDNMLETLFNESGTADIITFGINVLHTNEKGNVISKEVLASDFFYADTREKIGKAFYILSTAKIFQYACNKVYRRDFLKSSDVHYEDMRLGEDFFYNIQLFEKASTIKCMSYAFYNYIKPTTQTLTTSYSPIFFDLAKRKFKMEKAFLSSMNCQSEDTLNLVYFNHMKHFISALIRNQSASSNMNLSEKINFVVEKLRDETITELLNNYKPRGLQNKLIFQVLKTKIPLLCLMTAKLISIVQKNVR